MTSIGAVCAGTLYLIHNSHFSYFRVPLQYIPLIYDLYMFSNDIILLFSPGIALLKLKY